MVENDSKGWFGSFSIAGRESAEKYGIKKKKIMTKTLKKKLLKKILNPYDNDIDNKSDDVLEDEIDIFDKKYKQPNKLKIQKLKKSKSQKEYPNIYLNDENKGVLSNNERYKYHNNNIIRIERLKEEEKKKLLQSASISKYNPKMEYIWARSISGPKWNTLTPRKFNIVNNNWEIYKNPIPYIEEKKCLVNMQKQTMRCDIPLFNDSRIRFEKKYTPPKNKSILYNKLNIKKFNKTPNVNLRKKLLLSPKRNNENLINYDKGKLIPDFKKTVSRKNLYNIKKEDKLQSSNLIPNYSFIQERPIMMVLYDAKSYKKIQKDFKGMDTSFLFNIDKIYNKYNNHKRVNVPLFKDMYSRPNSYFDTLPSHMKGIYSRLSGYTITNKTLKMNNYIDSKFFDGYNTFFPKKSFNKIINMSLLNSEKNQIKENNIDNNSQFRNLANYFNKTINFYKSNYDNLIDENIFKKIDNVTYKTIERKNSLNLKDLEGKSFNEIDSFF